MKSAANYDYNKDELPDKETDNWNYILHGSGGNYFTWYFNISATFSIKDQSIKLLICAKNYSSICTTESDEKLSREVFFSLPNR